MSNGLKGGTRGTRYPPGSEKTKLGYPKNTWSCVEIQSRVRPPARRFAPSGGYAYPRTPRSLGDRYEQQSNLPINLCILQNLCTVQRQPSTPKLNESTRKPLVYSGFHVLSTNERRWYTTWFAQ